MRIIIIAAMMAVGLSAPASADTVCEWMAWSDQISDAFERPPGAPRVPDHDRQRTQVALAMFEALNAIDHRYESYLQMPVGDPEASQDAAAMTAAHSVLMAHYPEQKSALDDSYSLAMEALPDARKRDAGKAIGQAAAKLALASGGIDPKLAATPYRPRTAPGVWTATALPVIEPFAVTFRPWIINSVEELRPPPPPALDSARWATDFEEVKLLGGRNSTARTPQQSLMARYRITPEMMPSYRMIADAPGRSMVQNARMFAMVEMVADDAGMVTSAAKLHYNFWRPITAIRNAADDGNPATAEQRDWTPLINTPNHPEYPCGHCTYASGIATVLKSEVGNAPRGGVHVASASLPNSAIQVVPTFDQWVEEVSFSRTLGGVHYRFANEAGEAVGRAVAERALATIMRPLPGK